MQYSQFLRPFKRVYHLIGAKQDCQLIKSNYDSGIQDKLFQFIINEDISKAQNKQSPPLPQGGILRHDWLNKLLVTDPMLIILVFNSSRPLEALQKWEDRLVPIAFQINKAKQYIRSNPKKQMSLAIVIITPNGSLVPLDKIKQTVKITDRSLQIVQIQSLRSELKRIKNTWLNTWKSCLEQRIRQKQEQKGLRDETKLRGLIKLAILYQISSNDQTVHYQKAHAFCRQMYRGMDNIKQDDIQSFITKQQLRFLGDVLFLKAFKNWYKNNPLDSMSKFKGHYNEFRHKNLEGLKIFYYYEQLYWRSQFLIEMVNYILGVGMANTTVENRISELVKGIISYNIELSQIDQKIKLSSAVLQELPCQYSGRLNYKVVNQATFVEDFKNTRLSFFVYRAQQFLQQGLLLINQLKDIKKLKGHEQDNKKIRPHEEIFYSISECRIYIHQNNLQKAVKIYNSIVDSFLKKNDFLILNCLLKQFQPLLQKNQHHAELVQFYLVAIKILDYFKSLQLLPSFVKQLQSTASQLKSPKAFSVAKGSCLIQIKVDYQTITSLLSEKIKINIALKLHPEISRLFKIMVIKFKKNIADVTQLKILDQQVIEIQPSDYLTQQDILEIEQVEFKGNNLVWIVKGENINYIKKNRVHIIMPMKDPIIKITQFYKKCYTNQYIPIEIKIINNNQDTKVLSKVQFKQQKTEQSAQCFVNTQKSLNLINTQTHIKLSQNTPHMFYLKFPTDGQRKLLVIFKTQMIKTYYNSKGQKKQVKKPLKKYQEERKFNLEPMIIVSKRLTVPSNEYLTKKIELKENIYRIPANQNVMIQYYITSQENLILTGIKQEQLDDNVKFIRRLNIKDVELQSKVSLKVFSIVKVLNAKQLSNLPSLRIDWKRKNEHIENTFVDIEEKLSIKQKILSIEFKQSDVSKKWEIGTVHYRVNNHSAKKIRVRVEALETENILIVGKNKTDIIMAEQSHVILAFKVLPLTVGEIMLPELLIRADEKMEAKLQKKHIAFVL